MKKNYEELIKTNKVQKGKIKLVNGTKKDIEKIYKNIAKIISVELKNKDENNFNEQSLKQLQKKINKELKTSNKEIKAVIENATAEMIGMAVENNIEYFYEIDKKYGSNLVEIFKDKYIGINKVVIDAVIRGNMYKDNHSLSNRIWIDYKKNKNSIDAIIKNGIKNSDNAIDIAKRLEKFINPTIRKDFRYPGMKSTSEYNALRLARTSINHAHHQSVIEMAKRNPVVTHIEWLSAGAHGRTCSLCSQRDGRLYQIGKDTIPQDHPNGMCMLLEVQPSDKEWEKMMDAFIDSDYEDFDEFIEIEWR